MLSGQGVTGDGGRGKSEVGDIFVEQSPVSGAEVGKQSSTCANTAGDFTGGKKKRGIVKGDET